MNIRRHGAKVITLVVVGSMPLLGLSAVASAKAAVGSAKWCAAHPVLAKTKPACSTSTGKGTGGDPPTITVQIDPNPLVETYQSYIVATVQVETSASFANDAVTVSSSQLSASCTGGTEFYSIAAGATSGADSGTVILDDDGNATLLMIGADCAPGSDVVEADLDVAPYYTALGTLVAEPPVVTTAGVYGYPTYSGTVTTGEVETGDTTASGNSDVYAVFYVETDPVYAEQEVEISSSELESRCGQGWFLGSFSDLAGTEGSGMGTVEPPAVGTLDDDGNAVFLFEGASCAPTCSPVPTPPTPRSSTSWLRHRPSDPYGSSDCQRHRGGRSGAPLWRVRPVVTHRSRAQGVRPSTHESALLLLIVLISPRLVTHQL